MNQSEQLKKIPYWDEDDEDSLPSTIPVESDIAPVAGNRGFYLCDECGQFNFPSCFAERL